MKVEEGTDWSGEPCREEKRERFSGPANWLGSVFGPRPYWLARASSVMLYW